MVWLNHLYFPGTGVDLYYFQTFDVGQVSFVGLPVHLSHLSSYCDASRRTLPSKIALEGTALDPGEVGHPCG